MSNRIHFSDLPSHERWRLLNAIDEYGGAVETYVEDSVSVALPRDTRTEFIAAMDRLGLKIVLGTMNYWPLGTDVYPDTLRHDASYPNSRGFTCIARFNVPDFCLF